MVCITKNEASLGGDVESAFGMHILLCSLRYSNVVDSTLKFVLSMMSYDELYSYCPLITKFEHVSETLAVELVMCYRSTLLCSVKT